MRWFNASWGATWAGAHVFEVTVANASAPAPPAPPLARHVVLPMAPHLLRLPAADVNAT
eukprot:gene48991-32912_t